MCIMSRKANSATLRLKQDYLRLKKDPVPYVTAEPVPNNILEWHYVVEGPEGSPYHGGLYHGKLVFPREFPFKPPSIYMITPNGRFKCNTRLCLSISDFHPDTWNPAWSVSTILTGLLSFMLETSPTLGSYETSLFEKKQLAAQSIEFNLKDSLYCELFPEIVELSKEKIRKRNEARNSLPACNLVREQLNQEQSNLQATITNVCVLVGVAAFAYIVRYVIKNLASDFHE